jgi:hypothetical protein
MDEGSRTSTVASCRLSNRHPGAPGTEEELPKGGQEISPLTADGHTVDGQDGGDRPPPRPPPPQQQHLKLITDI